MRCHCGDATDFIQPSVAMGTFPCTARSAVTIVLVCGNSETAYGQSGGAFGCENDTSEGPGNGFALAPTKLKTLLAIAAFATGPCTRTPPGTCPGQEMIKGTCTSSKYNAAP